MPRRTHGLIILADLTNVTRRFKNQLRLLEAQLDSLSAPCSWLGTSSAGGSSISPTHARGSTAPYHKSGAFQVGVVVAYDGGYARHAAWLDMAAGRWPEVQWIDLQARGLWNLEAVQLSSRGLWRPAGAGRTATGVTFDLGYRLMCDFWSHGVWQLAADLHLEWILRLDTDSVLLCGRSASTGHAAKVFQYMHRHNLSYGYFHRSWDTHSFARGFNMLVKQHVDENRLGLAGTFGGGRLFQIGRGFALGRAA